MAAAAVGACCTSAPLAHRRISTCWRTAGCALLGPAQLSVHVLVCACVRRAMRGRAAQTGAAWTRATSAPRLSRRLCRSRSGSAPPTGRARGRTAQQPPWPAGARQTRRPRGRERGEVRVWGFENETVWASVQVSRSWLDLRCCLRVSHTAPTSVCAGVSRLSLCVACASRCVVCLHVCTQAT